MKDISEISRKKDIAHRMLHQPPAGCVVYPETDGSYTVLDPSCAVELRVRFDLHDSSAPYIFYIDRQGVLYADSFDEVRDHIRTVVQKKLDKQKRRPPAEPSINRIIDYHSQGIPMAFIAPGSPDTADPTAGKHILLPIKQDLDNRVRVFGFGYHHVRGVTAEDTRFFLLYGKPNKKSEQLLKKIATELGQKSRSATMPFMQ